MQIRDNFKKGSVEMMILSLLKDGDLYGYEMSQLIQKRGGGYISIPEGSLYPTLYKLEEKNCISSCRKQVGKRLSRVYYHIEEEGLRYLTEMMEEFYAVNETIRKIIEYKPE